MYIRLIIDIEAEHASGVFASLDGIAEQLLDDTLSSDPGEVEVDGSTYEITSFEGEVDWDHMNQMKAEAKKRRAAARKARQQN